MKAKDFKRGFMRVKYVSHNENFAKVEFYYHHDSRRYRVVCCDKYLATVTRRLSEATKFFNRVR